MRIINLGRIRHFGLAALECRDFANDFLPIAFHKSATRIQEMFGFFCSASHDVARFTPALAIRPPCNPV